MITDLEAKKLLDRTLIVIATEFGRPEEFDSGGGRGHQPTSFTLVLAGGGLKRRGAYGATDDLSDKIVENRVTVPDFLATIHAAMGIDPTKNLNAATGRCPSPTAGNRLKRCSPDRHRTGSLPFSLFGYHRLREHGRAMAGYAPHRSLINILLFAAALLGCVGITRAELTKALEIRSLSYDEAKAGLEVKLRGTVTFIEGPGAVFVQDETAGTFFRPEKLNKLRPGDVVEVTGRTQPGNYLPGIGLAPYRIIGHGPLPEAVTVGYDDFTSGKYHYQRVAIEGIARSVTPIGEGRSVLRIDVASRIVEAWVDAGIETRARSWTVVCASRAWRPVGSTGAGNWCSRTFARATAARSRFWSTPRRRPRCHGSQRRIC